ncbi:CoA activase [Candidatus Bathyarchaeota archaeon]|nr:CoA activase [Candidatus Bathyarchaeota archaeon]NIU80765.1 CoA activase [Candidatus Bathyarchaeota archaeon]NIV67390.1 CoA activase [Candidatus Bathyarchaeota archaeon]NIW15934.1 CoA activase [Candidatus Bathyarchaeota archaeon]NIW34036.1 CoA activase [Candidatus Bathyarchaeota archaeon]
MITAGIDMGSKNVKVLILRDREIFAQALALSGFDQRDTAGKTLQKALQRANLALDDLEHITATGAGKDVAPHVNGEISMMGADALGGTNLFPSARTVIDVGAEEGRAVKCDENGKMVDFVINERCAAGAGTFVEAMARALELDLEEMGPLSLKAKKAVPMNAQCTIFAESEVVSLIHAQTPKADISRAIHNAIADRIASMARRLGIEKDVALVGGVAKNVGFIGSLKRALGVELLVPEEPEFVGALGAALLTQRGGGSR